MKKSFLSYLEEVNLLDPVLLADKSMANSYFMVIGTKDTKVPTVTQEKLWTALGKPKNVTRLPLGHRGAGFSYRFTFKKVHEFFSQF